MLSTKKKLSGHAYRKKRKELERTLKNQTNSLNKFLNGNDISPPNLNLENTPSCSTVQNLQCNTLNEMSSKLDDPGSWPHLTDKIISYLVEKGPEQIYDFAFPVTSGRKFNVKHYERVLANGDKVIRSWLIYSVLKNCVFCFCCKLFSKNSTNSLSSCGYCDWNHIVRLLKEHEQSINHKENFKTWKEYEIRIKNQTTIDQSLQKNYSKEVQHWRDVLKRLLICVEFLCIQSLSFRGKSDNLYDKNNGNFLKLVEAIAKFDPVLTEHLRRINDLETQNKYLSKDIQNELIQIFAGLIKKKIMEMVKTAKYYSIIVDCTPDLSRKEQVSLILRIVHKKEKEFEIKEYFIGFLIANDTTGSGLKDLILNELTNLGLSIHDCRGQGYDNGSNMKGKNIGMQAQIKNLEPRAFFMPCASHSLNLVIADSVHCSNQAVKFFNTVQNLYNFFSNSISRWDILKKNIQKFTLKPLCNTRWESRLEALKPLMYNLEDIYESLVELSNDNDSLTRSIAEGLGNSIIKFEFLCCLILWFKILEKINIVSKYLQSPGTCLTTAINILESCKTFLENLRCDESFNSLINEAKEIAIKLEIEPYFPPSSALRSRRKPNIASDDLGDDVHLNLQYKFKIEFYYKVLDQAIQSVTDRFHQIKEHNNDFKFLYELQKISSNNVNDLQSHCLSLEKSLSRETDFDINGLELFEELKTFEMLMSERPTSPLKTLELIYEKKLESIFPNLIISLKVLLTIPITVASAERSFSKLKIIKNYLRTTISQERLTGLALIAIESDLLKNLDYDELINDFAKLKARRINF